MNRNNNEKILRLIKELLRSLLDLAPSLHQLANAFFNTIAVHIAKTNDKAVPVQTGYHAVKVNRNVNIRATRGIPVFACFGAANADIIIKTKVKSKARITPACVVVVPSIGATDASQSSQTILTKK